MTASLSVIQWTGAEFGVDLAPRKGTGPTVPAMESPALGEALSRAFQDWGSATREQRIVAHFFLFSFFKLSESAWCQCKNDVLDEEQWVGWETLLCAMYHSKGVKEGWWQYGGNIVRTPTRPNFRAISRAAKSRKGEMRGLYDLFAPTR